MRALITAVAGPRSETDNRKSWLARAAHRAGITARQCKALWYNEITDPEHKAARRMHDAAARRAGELANKFETIASALNVRDQDFHRADILALLSISRSLRGLDHAGPPEQNSGESKCGTLKQSSD